MNQMQNLLQEWMPTGAAWQDELMLAKWVAACQGSPLYLSLPPQQGPQAQLVSLSMTVITRVSCGQAAKTPCSSRGQTHVVMQRQALATQIQMDEKARLLLEAAEGEWIPATAHALPAATRTCMFLRCRPPTVASTVYLGQGRSAGSLLGIDAPLAQRLLNLWAPDKPEGVWR